MTFRTMRKACVKNVIVSVAEKQEPQNVSIQIEWAMQGDSATSATVIGITRSLETKASRWTKRPIWVTTDNSYNPQMTEFRLGLRHVSRKSHIKLNLIWSISGPILL